MARGGILLFDIDNTILKASTSHRKAFHVGIRLVYGIDANVDSINPHGMTDRQILKEVLKKCGLSEHEITLKMEHCIEAIAESFSKFIDDEQLIVLEGVSDLLEELQQRDLMLGIVSGNIESIAWEKLKRTDLRDYFGFGGFGSDDIKRSNLVRIAVKRAEQHPEFSADAEIFLIGDTPRDIDAGREAGVHTIGVATGIYSAQQLLSSGADHALNSFKPSSNFVEIIKSYNL